MSGYRLREYHILVNKRLLYLSRIADVLQSNNAAGRSNGVRDTGRPICENRRLGLWLISPDEKHCSERFNLFKTRVTVP